MAGTGNRRGASLGRSQPTASRGPLWAQSDGLAGGPGGSGLWLCIALKTITRARGGSNSGLLPANYAPIDGLGRLAAAVRNSTHR